MGLSPDVDNVVNNSAAPANAVPEAGVWETLRDQLKDKVSQINYNNWFKPITNAFLDGELLVICLPNKFIADWITDYYVEMIEKAASTLFGRELRVKFDIAEEKAPQKKSTNGHSQEIPEAVKEASNAQVPPQTPFTAPSRPALLLPPPRLQTATPLNPKYTFESFVVGGGNQLAHAAAKAVAELPGGHYNPLFLCGGVGLGKTHLLNAVGIELLRKNPNFKILYVSSEKFMNEFINSVRHDKMTDFRKKYRESCDMLLIDDIQFLGGKESTQDEFFHTFNALYDSHRQVIVTSDKFPKEIPGLEERLRSRLEWGLIADIQPPDFETRIAILRKKAESDKIILSNDVAMYLAREVKSNVRELEGALIRLNAFASLKQSAITLDLAQEILKNIFPSRENRPLCTTDGIQKAVADYYQIQLSELKSHRRTKTLAYPRQVAMYLCKKHLKLSFPEIGQKFGGKDHTTVIHACRKIEALLNADPNLQNDLEILEKTILH